jgi:hypothetical protein
MLKFNSGGYLVPDTAIKSSVSELEKEFVQNYTSVERSALFGTYLDYSNDLKKLCGDVELLQWVDGSFVTKRKTNPSDVDMITFVPIEIVIKLKEKIKPFIYPESIKNYPGVDAYVVEVHEKGSNDFFSFQADRLYWRQQFDTTRRNRAGNKMSKGFLEIIY